MRQRVSASAHVLSLSYVQMEFVVEMHIPPGTVRGEF
jgi:hypothetical protein